MRIMVAGASGAVGRHLLPKLVQRGHSVAGLARSPAKTDRICKAGAEAIVVDALDRAAVNAAVARARPDVIVHELTPISGASGGCSEGFLPAST